VAVAFLFIATAFARALDFVPGMMGFL